MVVLVDERGQDVDGTELVGEGELMTLAESVTPQTINFMARHASGPLNVTASGARLEALGLKLATGGHGPRGAAVMVSVNTREVSGTGVSAHDRAATIRKLADPASLPDDFVQPGHITPLRAQVGGVLRRAGHTEASVDMAVLAGCQPVGLISAILDEDGEVASTPYLLEFARQHGLKIASIKDLIAYRRRTEKLISLEARSTMPTRFGEFELFAYRSLVDDSPYIALVMGDVSDGEDTLVRMHSACLTGDALGSFLCDCGDQLQQSLELIAREGRGVLVYIQNHEGRGIGILHKMKAYQLQRTEGLDTIEANHALGLPHGCPGLWHRSPGPARPGVERRPVPHQQSEEASGSGGIRPHRRRGRCPSLPTRTPHNIRYLKTKRDKMGHTTLLERDSTLPAVEGEQQNAKSA